MDFSTRPLFSPGSVLCWRPFRCDGYQQSGVFNPCQEPGEKVGWEALCQGAFGAQVENWSVYSKPGTPFGLRHMKSRQLYFFRIWILEFPFVGQHDFPWIGATLSLDPAGCIFSRGTGLVFAGEVRVGLSLPSGSGFSQAQTQIAALFGCDDFWKDWFKAQLEHSDPSVHRPELLSSTTLLPVGTALVSERGLNGCLRQACAPCFGSEAVLSWPPSSEGCIAPCKVRLKPHSLYLFFQDF